MIIYIKNQTGRNVIWYDDETKTFTNGDMNKSFVMSFSPEYPEDVTITTFSSVVNETREELVKQGYKEVGINEMKKNITKAVANRPVRPGYGCNIA